MAQSEPKLTGLKKRQQIESANRTMFIWVAAAAVAVSFCIVAAQFLYQKWEYNNKVLGVKMKAADTLNQNIKNAKTLQDEVNALVSNKELAAVKTDQNDPNTKSVLDALPSKLDATALATSLQKAILSRSGVTIESITIPQATTVSTDGTESTENAEPKPAEIAFTISVSGSYDKIRNLLLDFERTIRPMKINNLAITGSDTSMRASLEMVTYYQPAKSASVKEEVVAQ